MAVYMVERNWLGVMMDQLASAQRAAIDTAKELTAKGENVRYIRSTFVLGEWSCMCLFEARARRWSKR